MIEEDTEYDDGIEDTEIIKQGINKAIKKENKHFKCANVLAILAFTSLLVILTIDNEYISNLNNYFTVVAFVSVMLNMIIKDNYKSKSLEEINKLKKNLMLDK